MKKTTKFASLSLAAFALLASSSCSNMGAEGQSTLGGAAGGAIAGGVLGNNVEGISKEEGAVAGAVVGGLLGNQSGRQQEQINQLKAQVGAGQQRVVQIRNSNGSVTPVVLVRTPQGFQGPRGELYSTLPSSAQLRPVYGF